jgi:hypothetical protein
MLESWLLNIEPLPGFYVLNFEENSKRESVALANVGRNHLKNLFSQATIFPITMRGQDFPV